jgi:hypothetical protein
MRGSGLPKCSLDEALSAGIERPSVMLAIDDALCELERKDPRKTKLIEMRFFGGLTAEESAEVLELPVEKVRGELRVAQAWFERELNTRHPPETRTGLRSFPAPYLFVTIYAARPLGSRSICLPVTGTPAAGRTG